jgi:hypothetical protein
MSTLAFWCGARGTTATCRSVAIFDATHERSGSHAADAWWIAPKCNGGHRE